MLIKDLELHSLSTKGANALNPNWRVTDRAHTDNGQVVVDGIGRVVAEVLPCLEYDNKVLVELFANSPEMYSLLELLAQGEDVTERAKTLVAKMNAT